MWWLALLIYVAGAGGFWALIADMVRSGHTSAHLMNIVFVVLWPIMLVAAVVLALVDRWRWHV